MFCFKSSFFYIDFAVFNEHNLIFPLYLNLSYSNYMKIMLCIKFEVGHWINLHETSFNLILNLKTKRFMHNMSDYGINNLK